MNCTIHHVRLPLLLVAALSLVPTLVCSENPSPGPQQSLLPMLHIDWKRGPNLPQGFQDSDGGILSGQLITVGGFCSGGLNADNQHKPGRYPRGFLNKAWALHLKRPSDGWHSITPFPGAPRQGLSAVHVGDALLFWGGFSYSEPFCYRDGWRLSRHEKAWKWDPLPSTPWPLSSPAMAVIGSRIYVFGGADYDAMQFYTDVDRNGKTERLGARLLVIDANRLEDGWQELPACPGSPRWVHTMAAVDGKLYVLGGATGNTVRDGTSYGYCTVVDNWRFDPGSKKWTRLRDLAISSGNFPRSTSNVFKGRYVLLPGGHQYDYVSDLDGTIRKKYGTASSANPASGLYNNVFVYDIRTNLFGTAGTLPIDNNLPMTVVRGNQVYLVGGETGGGVVLGEYYGHHPDLLLQGTISTLPR